MYSVFITVFCYLTCVEMVLLLAPVEGLGEWVGWLTETSLSPTGSRELCTTTEWTLHTQTRTHIHTQAAEGKESEYNLDGVTKTGRERRQMGKEEAMQ